MQPGLHHLTPTEREPIKRGFYILSPTLTILEALQAGHLWSLGAVARNGIISVCKGGPGLPSHSTTVPRGHANRVPCLPHSTGRPHAPVHDSKSLSSEGVSGPEKSPTRAPLLHMLVEQLLVHETADGLPRTEKLPGGPLSSLPT